MRISTVSFLVLVVLLCTPELLAARPSGFDGMVRITNNAFLVVKDFKTSIDDDPRVGVLTVSQDSGFTYKAIQVDDWQEGEEFPNDLEACCAIPGRQHEYLLAESGFYKNRFGRVFHVRVVPADDHWTLHVLGILRDPYGSNRNEEGTTFVGDQVEGLACFQSDGEHILVYAKRGGLVNGEQQSARIGWGEVDFDHHAFRPLGEQELVNQNLLGDRGCSDLLIVPRDDRFWVWSVATIDAGDVGPFRSVVYLAGALVPGRTTQNMRFVRQRQPTIHADLQGLKVEALAEPTSAAPQSGFSIGTDDELFGGIWRPLFK